LFGALLTNAVKYPSYEAEFIAAYEAAKQDYELQLSQLSE
jgi:hypothetical protein